MDPHNNPPELTDDAPTLVQFRSDVVRALQRTPPHLPPKYFYDIKGSGLFEQITKLPEYYPTLTERTILADNIADIASIIGPRAFIVDAGSHLSKKVEPILEALEDPAGYAPIEISAEMLERAVDRLHETFPTLSIFPQVADFTNDLELPLPDPPPARGVVFFPGSTIGNLERGERQIFLNAFHDLATSSNRIPGGLLISTDLHKPASIIEPAYNDQQQVTAEFNLNILRRIKRELDADLDTNAFEHRAIYDQHNMRIEMRLIATHHTQITIPRPGEDPFELPLNAGEHLVTEYSHKFTPEGFADELTAAGFELKHRWTDKDNLFAVNYAVCE